MAHLATTLHHAIEGEIFQKKKQKNKTLLIRMIEVELSLESSNRGHAWCSGVKLGWKRKTLYLYTLIFL